MSMIVEERAPETLTQQTRSGVSRFDAGARAGARGRVDTGRLTSFLPMSIEFHHCAWRNPARKITAHRFSHEPMNATAAKPETAYRLSRSELRRRWRQLADNPVVAAIPGKVELNEKGAIVVSPPTFRHAFIQGFLIRELARQRPEGTTLPECPVETEIGIRVPDVVVGLGGVHRATSKREAASSRTGSVHRGVVADEYAARDR